MHVDLGVGTLRTARDAEAFVELEGGMRLAVVDRNTGYYVLALNS